MQPRLWCRRLTRSGRQIIDGRNRSRDNQIVCHKLLGKAAAINLLSKHKAAILVKEMPKNEGVKSQLSGRDVSGGIAVIPPESVTPTLTDLGITKGEAQQLRNLATLDEAEVQAYIVTTVDKGRDSDVTRT